MRGEGRKSLEEERRRGKGGEEERREVEGEQEYSEKERSRGGSRIITRGEEESR